MKKDYFSTEEIRVIIREAFADEVEEIINTAPEDVHPGNSVRRGISAAEKRLLARFLRLRQGHRGADGGAADAGDKERES